MIRERQIEDSFIQKLKDLKYSYRPDINNRATLEQNFREKFERLNRVHLTDSEFNRLLEDITDSDVFLSSKRLRERNTFIREDGTPLQYTLVNIKEWLMSLNVTFSNVWGIILKDWKGCSSKTITVLVIGLLVLIVSSFLPELLK